MFKRILEKLLPSLFAKKETIKIKFSEPIEIPPGQTLNIPIGTVRIDENGNRIFSFNLHKQDNTPKPKRSYKKKQPSKRIVKIGHTKYDAAVKLLDKGGYTIATACAEVGMSQGNFYRLKNLVIRY